MIRLRLLLLLELLNSIRREDPELWARIEAFARKRKSKAA